MKPVIAIVGRANVGKSALFNRLTGEKLSIVEDLPGTTRDRIFADTTLDQHEVTLIDTGGLDPLPVSTIDTKIRNQIEAAITEADIIIFLVDSRSGILPTDFKIAVMLRKSDKPIILAASKVDNTQQELQIHDFYQLGLGTPLPVSAQHGRGIVALVEKIESLIPENQIEPASSDSRLKLAIVGRPNAGKSMLLNTIIGNERAIVDSIAGTTRDAIDTNFQYNDQNILLIDTAGIRHKGHRSIGIEYYSLIRSLRAISRCDIALLVIDAAESVTAQDIHIAGYIREAYKGLIIVVNKWDLVVGQKPAVFERMVKERIKFISHAPVLFVSSKERTGIDKIIPEAMKIWLERQKQFPDGVIDKLIKGTFEEHAPPRKGLRRLKIIRAYQDGINPPSFSFLVNDPELVHFSYKRYLENRLRHTFGFSGTALQLKFKKAWIGKPSTIRLKRSKQGNR